MTHGRREKRSSRLSAGSTVCGYRVLRLLKKLLDIIAEGDQLILVFELIKGPDLLEFLQQCGGRVPESLARYYFAQLVAAVGQMHAIDYCHRDLKLENLMIDACTKRLKVIDLGLASSCELAVTLGVGTPDYMSPELIVGKGQLDRKAVDIWSLGVILFGLVAGHLPFKRSERSKSNISVLCSNIMRNNMRSMPQDVSPECVDLMLSLLQQQPSDRPTVQQISQHPWLKPDFLTQFPPSESHCWPKQLGQALQQPTKIPAVGKSRPQ
ncbi:hypothetical protein WJX73_004639 [Symbiochloris irregularis]|uniref:Protein kinase domain-containing protein n=1 Tax=Symbiochloris irregularis TaxID=706552 RepID=A0AAW1PIL1_9CHLO